jgi:acetyl esterase/lipase
LWPSGAPGAASADAPLEERTPRLTPFPAVATAPSAAVVVCPGGGYRGRAAHEGAPVARWLNSLGIAAFELDYRVAP